MAIRASQFSSSSSFLSKVNLKCDIGGDRDDAGVLRDLM
jgi:hypothetical protein